MKNQWEDRGNHICIFVYRKGEYKECLIDKEDFDKVNSINGTWSTSYTCGNLYANYTWWEGEKTKSIRLHHIILGKPPKGLVTDHKNINSLDNRKENLHFVTKKKNVENRRYDRKGFTIRFKKGKWETNSTIRPERKYIGRFPTKKMAMLAVLEYTKKANEGRPTYTENIYEKIEKELLNWATIVN